MILASSLMFIQCTSDPIEGPQGLSGIDGVNGINGTDGTNGVDGTASCVACHNTSHKTAVNSSYALSGHAAGVNVAYAGGRDSCSRCHSNEGYINYITGKPAVAIASPTAVGCTTCHEKHSTFDFVNDGQDYALRNIAPVALDLTDVSYTIAFTDKGSNTCTSCHQARSKAPTDDDNDGLYLQTNTRFYPHYSGQAQMIEGIQGAVIANGSTAYPTPGTGAHRTGASCTSCHMSSSTDGKTGMHTFKPNYDSCKKCHTTTVPMEVAGLAADMATLHNKLVALGLIDEAGSTLKQTANIPFKTAQALWNYKTVEEDHSRGIHNPKYAKALIKNALQVVQ